MAKFATIREAKDYIAAAIADEATRQGSPMSEIECKMLYFSETAWTLPEMKTVSEEFDRSYDQDSYERRIGQLIRSIEHDENRTEDESQAWVATWKRLSRGDHYLHVLASAGQPERRILGVSPAWLPSSAELVRAQGRPKGDFWRLLLVATGILALLLLALRPHELAPISGCPTLAAPLFLRLGWGGTDRIEIHFHAVGDLALILKARLQH